jgi:tripartite-type tricarboxylate transporter receptor subunit TctC
LRALPAAVVLLALAGGAAAEYPDRPIRLVVPQAAGSATDNVSRTLAPELGKQLGQNVVVDNRPGGALTIGIDAVAKAPPDGYTLLVGNVSTNAINENTFAQQLQIKPSRDLVGIAKLVEIPHILAVTAGFPGSSLAELVAEARRNPGKINYASAGLGSYPHLDMEKLQKAAGIELTHVPYKGGAGQMIPSLISGETTVAFINMSSTLGHIRGGRLKPLATAAPRRLAELPEVPTLTELGYPGIGTNAWQGMFAPAATPRPIIDKLYSSVAAVLSRPEMRESLAKQMMSVELSNSPQDFTELVRKETQSWGEFLREAKIKVE